MGGQTPSLDHARGGRCDANFVFIARELLGVNHIGLRSVGAHACNNSADVIDGDATDAKRVHRCVYGAKPLAHRSFDLSFGVRRNLGHLGRRIDRVVSDSRAGCLSRPTPSRKPSYSRPLAQPSRDSLKSQYRVRVPQSFVPSSSDRSRSSQCSDEVKTTTADSLPKG